MSVIPCHRGGHVCRWPACPFECDGRPGRELKQKFEIQKEEFDAVARLADQYRRLSQTPVVDDDYISVRKDYELAVKEVMAAFAANGR